MIWMPTTAAAAAGTSSGAMGPGKFGPAAAAFSFGNGTSGGQLQLVQIQTPPTSFQSLPLPTPPPTSSTSSTSISAASEGASSGNGTGTGIAAGNAAQTLPTFALMPPPPPPPPLPPPPIMISTTSLSASPFLTTTTTTNPGDKEVPVFMTSAVNNSGGGGVKRAKTYSGSKAGNSSSNKMVKSSSSSSSPCQQANNLPTLTFSSPSSLEVEKSSNNSNNNNICRSVSSGFSSSSAPSSLVYPEVAKLQQQQQQQQYIGLLTSPEMPLKSQSNGLVLPPPALNFNFNSSSSSQTAAIHKTSSKSGGGKSAIKSLLLGSPSSSSSSPLSFQQSLSATSAISSEVNCTQTSVAAVKGDHTTTTITVNQISVGGDRIELMFTSKAPPAMGATDIADMPVLTTTTTPSQQQLTKKAEMKGEKAKVKTTTETSALRNAEIVINEVATSVKLTISEHCEQRFAAKTEAVEGNSSNSSLLHMMATSEESQFTQTETADSAFAFAENCSQMMLLADVAESSCQKIAIGGSNQQQQHQHLPVNLFDPSSSAAASSSSTTFEPSPSSPSDVDVFIGNNNSSCNPDNDISQFINHSFTMASTSTLSTATTATANDHSNENSANQMMASYSDPLQSLGSSGGDSHLLADDFISSDNEDFFRRLESMEGDSFNNSSESLDMANVDFSTGGGCTVVDDVVREFTNMDNLFSSGGGGGGGGLIGVGGSSIGGGGCGDGGDLTCDGLSGIIGDGLDEATLLADLAASGALFEHFERGALTPSSLYEATTTTTTSSHSPLEAASFATCHSTSALSSFSSSSSPSGLGCSSLIAHQYHHHYTSASSSAPPGLLPVGPGAAASATSSAGGLDSSALLFSSTDPMLSGNAFIFSPDSVGSLDNHSILLSDGSTTDSLDSALSMAMASMEQQGNRTGARGLGAAVNCAGSAAAKVGSAANAAVHGLPVSGFVGFGPGGGPGGRGNHQLGAYAANIIGGGGGGGGQAGSFLNDGTPFLGLGCNHHHQNSTGNVSELMSHMAGKQFLKFFLITLKLTQNFLFFSFLPTRNKSAEGGRGVAAVRREHGQQGTVGH